MLGIGLSCLANGHVTFQTQPSSKWFVFNTGIAKLRAEAKSVRKTEGQLVHSFSYSPVADRELGQEPEPRKPRVA